MARSTPTMGFQLATPPGRRTGVSTATGRKRPPATTEEYVGVVIEDVRVAVLERVNRLVAAGMPLPSPRELADLLEANLPDPGPEELDPHFAGLGPFYTSDGAIRQLGGVSKQAVDSRRRSETILAMQAGDGTWLYPAWQFTGDGSIHAVLVPVIKALRGMDRWQAGVWMVSEHPDLGGVSPRQALREGVAPEAVAALAAHDKAQYAA